MSPFDRREFLNRTAILSAAVAAGTSLRADDATKTVSAKKGSANDRLRVAVVGVHGRGMDHVRGYLGRNNCEVTHICDADSSVIGNAMKNVEKVQGAAPTYVQDFRKLIELKDVDLISIATPNHWHATMAVWAMAAGKDVYSEKPASHNVHEGRLMVNAANKFKRICQIGTQSRSTAGMRGAMKHIHDGKIGKVSLAYGTCYKRRKSIGKVTKATDPAKTVNYDLWSGPAPLLPIMRKSMHYDWHWIYEYGNGDLGNQGVHEMDKARWGLGKATLPASVVSIGGRFGYVDDGETANTQLSLFDYGDANLIFEVRGLETKDYKGIMVGNIFFGTEGYVVCPNYSSGIAYNNDGKKVAEFKGGGDGSHYDNFIKAVRSRNTSDLNCPATEGHLSAALCHLANISYRLGEKHSFDQPTSCMTGCKDAVAALDRMKEHLKANEVDLSKAVGLVGPKLMVDNATEKFVGAPAKANDMLFREYRKGYEITKVFS
ncbi:MAG: Gfo/Idh/MocA family oxidoreductase [Gemmataceae bacterium]